jgi:hypothetical protein
VAARATDQVRAPRRTAAGGRHEPGCPRQGDWCAGLGVKALRRLVTHVEYQVRYSGCLPNTLDTPTEDRRRTRESAAPQRVKSHMWGGPGGRQRSRWQFNPVISACDVPSFSVDLVAPLDALIGFGLGPHEQVPICTPRSVRRPPVGQSQGPSWSSVSPVHTGVRCAARCAVCLTIGDRLELERRPRCTSSQPGPWSPGRTSFVQAWLTSSSCARSEPPANPGWFRLAYQTEPRDLFHSAWKRTSLGK